MRKKLLLVSWCVWLSVSAAFAQSSWSDHANLSSLQKFFSQTRGALRRFEVADSICRKYNESDLVISGWFARQVHRLADSVGTKAAAIKANSALSLATAYEGDYSGSVSFSERELALARAASDTLAIIQSHINLGDNYIELGRFNMAYFHTAEAMELARTAKSLIDISIVTHNFGRIHKELGQYEQAEKFLMQADSLSHLLKDRYAPMFTLREIGDMCVRKGDYACAAIKLNSALRLSHQLQSDVIRTDIYLDLGKLYIANGDYPLAKTFFDSAGLMSRRLGNKLVEARCLLGYGTIEARSGNKGEAAIFIQKAFEIATRLHARTVQMDALSQLSGIAESSGDFKTALQYYRRYEQLKDSLYNQELPDQTLKYQMDFLRRAKDRELDERKEQIERQHLYRNVLIAGIILLGIMLYLLYRNNRRRLEINKLLVSHQEELEKRSRDLEDINQMKDKFFSIISHDLRAPINSLAGVLNLMEKNGVSAEELPMLTRELRLQFNHARNLITNLLNWAMIQMDKISLKKERLDLNATVEENFRLARSLSNKQVSLVNSVDPGLTVLADSNMINLVLRNLITNAMKFTETGGTIMVAAQDEADQVTVRVQDNGVGIPEEVQSKLLARNSSYSTIGTANEKGTGLGLGLCREFVERNGGKIWLTSKVGEGTTFYFTLPKS